ncbi:hypothetical protein D3C81_2297890 [compost metagenome]
MLLGAILGASDEHQAAQALAAILARLLPVRRVDVQQVAHGIEAQGRGHPLGVQYQHPTEAGQCCAQVGS